MQYQANAINSQNNEMVNSKNLEKEKLTPQKNAERQDISSGDGPIRNSIQRRKNSHSLDL